ncbi:hypothetical protein [Rhodoferax aquaticus]|uniref:Tetratricopeptide repeat protein n=1 Tax=Rhodoferax aquaticus TaxID=2527691 RepID=A0A515EK99_9BURK|nr:hypothetical protein [Rhodoferax aquaticus]QDL53095.1 hypothetical protein EXZ61_02310 [Rhodoferax aquaticus]
MRFFVLSILAFFLTSLHAEDLMSSQLADQARQWHEKGRDDLAADLWRKILRADPKHAEAKARLAEIDNPMPAPTAVAIPMQRPPVTETKKPPETPKPKSLRPKEKPTPDLIVKKQEESPRAAPPPKSPSAPVKVAKLPSPPPTVSVEVAKEKVMKREIVRGRTTLDARSVSLPISRSISEPQPPSLGIGPVLSPLSPNTAPIPAPVNPAMLSQPASAVTPTQKR